MRVRVVQEPFNRDGLSTPWREGLVPAAAAAERIAAAGLFLASATATLTISVPGPVAAWAYALVVLAGACWWSFCSTASCNAKASASGMAVGASPRAAVGRAVVRRAAVWREAAMLILAACGALQWMTGATVYRYATFDAWTRTTALVAAGALARGALASERLRHGFLRAFVWFAAGVSGVAVLCYFTSPGRLLWIFPSPYPDTWGPFLSRNDFAAFLELALPAALWLGLRNRGPHTAPAFSRSAASIPSNRTQSCRSDPRVDRSSGKSRASTVYLCIAAWLVAAGVASASRAGSAREAARLRPPQAKPRCTSRQCWHAIPPSFDRDRQLCSGLRGYSRPDASRRGVRPAISKAKAAARGKRQLRNAAKSLRTATDPRYRDKGSENATRKPRKVK